MSNTQILNIGVPIAIGFILILVIGYGKSLDDDIKTKPKRELTSKVDLRDARENFEELTNDLNVMTSQIKEGIENLKKIEKIEESLQSIRNLSAKQQKKENSIQTRKLTSRAQISALEKNRNQAALLFAQNNNNKITNKDLTMIRSLKPETLKEFIEELETDNLAGAKNKLKHKTSNRKSHKHKKSKRK
jgi:hypothetical protein